MPLELQLYRLRNASSFFSMTWPLRTSFVVLLLLIIPVVTDFAQASDSTIDEDVVVGNSRDDTAGIFVPFRRYLDETATTTNKHNYTIAGRRLNENTSIIILAAERTTRRNPSNRFQYYTGGWNISVQNYWSSVGYTAAPLFLVAIVWFLGFGLVLLVICCCLCFCNRKKYAYSKVAYALSLIFLIIFTLAVVIGCAVLYSGQEKFHNSTSRTWGFIIGQANLIVENVGNLAVSMAEAKNIKVQNFFLSPELQADMDKMQVKLNASATYLSVRTNDNSHKIQNFLDKVRLQLIIVSAVMLVLAFLGFLLSLLGLQFLVSILILIGWILVTATFISSGVFLLLHNVFSDTCSAMGEWVEHPHAQSALEDVLPCLDFAAVNESLYQTKNVAFQLVNVVNNVIANVSNQNFSPLMAPLYYNQTGPFAPLLCNPFLPDMSTRNCSAGEVNLKKAAEQWEKYVCKSIGPLGSQTCTSVGRFTSDVYDQIVAASNVSFGLYHYAPFLTKLADCTFVRETFTGISKNECPGLEKYSRSVYVGLTMVSVAVMFSLIFWVIYARERRHRVYHRKLSVSRPPPSTGHATAEKVSTRF